MTEMYTQALSSFPVALRCPVFGSLFFQLQDLNGRLHQRLQPYLSRHGTWLRPRRTCHGDQAHKNRNEHCELWLVPIKQGVDGALSLCVGSTGLSSANLGEEMNQSPSHANQGIDQAPSKASAHSN